MSTTLKLARRKVREVIIKQDSMVVCEAATRFGVSAVDTPVAVADYWRGNIGSDPLFRNGQEHFHVLLMSVRRRVLAHSLVSVGVLDQVIVHPREVFRAAIVGNAHAIILVHNHPSGDPTPSEGDIRVTREMIRAGQLLKIDVLDHVVIGQPSPERARDYASLREFGYMNH